MFVRATMRQMHIKLARENHRFFGLIFFVGGLLLLGLLLSVPARAQRPYTYESYLQAIAKFRSDVARIDSPQACIETGDAIAAELEQISLIEMPDGGLMTVSHEGVAAALRRRPCSQAIADQYLNGLCPERMCPVSRPVPPVRSVDDGSSSGSDSLVGVAGGSGSGSAPPPAAGAGPPPAADQPASGSAPANDSNPGSADELSDSANSSDADAGQLEQGQEGEPVNSAEGGAAGESGDGNNPAAEGDAGEGENSLAAESSSSEGEKEIAPPPSPTPTPTLTPTPVPAASAEDNQENEGIPPWLLLVAGLAVLFIVGALALLFLPSDEEEEERQKKHKMAGAALTEGRKLVEEGDYREAVRHLFLATLLTLDEKGLLRYDATQTNYELLAQERLRPSLVPALAPVVGAYERVWYGLQPLPTNEYDLLVKRIREIGAWRLEADDPSAPQPPFEVKDGIS